MQGLRIIRGSSGFVPTEWDEQIPRGEPGWSVGGRIFLLWFENVPTRLRLILTIGLGPQEIRQQLFQIALDNQGVFRPAYRALNAKWNAVLIRPILSPKDYEALGAEELLAKVHGNWDDFVKHDLTQIKDAVAQGMSTDGK